MDLLRAAAFRYGRRNRARKAAFARSFMASHGLRSVLVVGAGTVGNAVDGVVERRLEAAASWIVFSGVAADVPWTPYVQADGTGLPFADGAFDLVYSNAVIEHVGDEEAQRQFLREHDRVGREWIATTPNRMFPVEAHSHTLFRHWAPSWRDPRGSVTRLLTPRSFERLLPRGRVAGTGLSPTLTAVSRSS